MSGYGWSPHSHFHTLNLHFQSAMLLTVIFPPNSFHEHIHATIKWKWKMSKKATWMTNNQVCHSVEICQAWSDETEMTISAVKGTFAWIPDRPCSSCVLKSEMKELARKKRRNSKWCESVFSFGDYLCSFWFIWSVILLAYVCASSCLKTVDDERCMLIENACCHYIF